MLKLLFLCVFCTYLGAFALTPEEEKEAEFHGKKFARQIRSEIESGSMHSLAVRSDEALSYMVEKGVRELEKAGYLEEAYLYQHVYNTDYRGFLSEMVKSDRDIGDHAGLSEFLTTFYDILELALGVETCKSLHLSDIKTFNHCLPVVFRPCTFPMDSVTIPRKAEYKNHFAEGKTYYGLVPVTVYWTINAPCVIGTAGIASLLCAPVSSVAEYSMANFLAPSLSDWVFEKACE